MNEPQFIAALSVLANHPAARGLTDDAAILTPPPGRDLVLTHDMIVEGVHFLPTDPPADVAWKLVAVNLSDLAAKGATPLGVLLGYTLGDAAWNAGFIAGLSEILEDYSVPLLGGDTVAAPAGARSYGLTAIGHVAPGKAPSRSGAHAGDSLWVCGTIGDAGLGLAIARGDLPLDGRSGWDILLNDYRRPVPLIAEGIALAAQAHAKCDVSDGLLIDAMRIAEASGLALTIMLEAVPRSGVAIAFAGDDRAARLDAATAGDDYALLAALPPKATAIPGAVCIGRFTTGTGLTITDKGNPIPLPDRLGYLHGASC